MEFCDNLPTLKVVTVLQCIGYDHCKFQMDFFAWGKTGTLTGRSFARQPPTSSEVCASSENEKERREITDLFNKYALYFRIYLIHVTIPIIQSYIQSSLSNKIFQKHV